MRSLALTALALVGAVSTAVAASSEPCVLHGASIGKFDLNPLRNKNSDYIATNPDGGSISLNFCGPADQGSLLEDAEKMGAYIEDSRGGISLGQYSTTPQYHNGQLSLTYKDGSACPSSNARRSSLIYLQCDKSWSTSGPTLIDSIDDCTYFFTMKTPHACPSTGGFFSAVWSIFVFLFWLSLALGAGFVIYSRFIANKSTGGGSGRVGEAISFVKDMFIIAGIWLLDTAQSLFAFLSRRRSSPVIPDYSYAYNHQPSSAPAASQSHPNYSSSAWRTGPPVPPTKDANGQGEDQTMPGLAGGGSLLDDDEEDEDEEAALAMPGTQGERFRDEV
ncbi:SPOSA6832_03106 [Sporobolomyces salmonicolor]|uniref:SPOSA6832_03106-mRNA-1:cds n=1 Tax=Sporidiobolus salmonicolor TaxID=5005 RepID=A0A0D6EP81_SPOSA|nr:SPOSA6832_03106 [Sporobolomyces salmonicolor]